MALLTCNYRKVIGRVERCVHEQGPWQNKKSSEILEMSTCRSYGDREGVDFSLLLATVRRIYLSIFKT